MGATYTLKPGWTTLNFEESIPHLGSPFRIAILDHDEVPRVVLLDHIPHNDAATNSDKYNETKFIQTKISVNIPDIKCTQCVMQLLYIMTDKIVKCGQPLDCYYDASETACKGTTDPDSPTCFGAANDIPCTEEGLCWSNCKWLFALL